jgi:hypothetical protein
MTRLNQILAIEKQVKSTAHEQTTAEYQLLQKDPLLSGISRMYRPLDEEGERLPEENTPVQVRVNEVLKRVAASLTPLLDATLARDLANTEAKANVEVDGRVILKDVPATYLLWLEKQLTDLHTIIVKLPTLSQADTWTFDAATDVYKTPAVETVRTKKLPRAFVKAEATKEHPAQVEVVHEDKLVGYWTTTKLSGALPKQRAQVLRTRIEKLMAATKQAREQANLVEVPKAAVGAEVFDFLFAD